MRWPGRFDPVAVAVAIVWLAVVLGPPLALLDWRERRLPAVGSAEYQAGWDEFRDDMRRQSGREGPVQRKIRKSVEPPELVWLRDYLLLAIAAWITLVGLLGGFLAAIALGVARAASTAGLAAASPAEDGAARGRHDQKQHERDSQHADERRHG